MACFSGPEIDQTGLLLAVDVDNIKSYPGSEDIWIDIVEQYTSTGSTSIPSLLTTPVGLSTAISELSVVVVLNILGTDSGYAYHPISKWNNTNDASFVLYHFQQFTDNLRTNLVQFYANRGGVWGAISANFYTSQGNTYVIALQYNSTTGGQLWVNGAKIGNRAGSGTLATNTTSIKIDGGPQERTGIHRTKKAWLWNREITDVEMIQYYNNIRSIYGI